MITPITQLTIAGGANTDHQGQSFTATENGAIHEIAVFLSGVFDGNLLIYNSDNGSAFGGTKGTPAYEQTGVVLPDGMDWKTVTLDTPYQVTSGETYSFIFEGLGSFSFADTDVYAGGSYIFNYGNVQADRDLAFFINPPEIDIKGNNISIANNTFTPSMSDGTDFGNTHIPIVQTFTIENLGSSDLLLSGGPLVTITGPDANLFTVQTLPADTIGVGQSTTFEITFTPGVYGPSTAQINIASNDLDEANYAFYVQGYSIEPPSSLTDPTPTEPIIEPDPIAPTEPVVMDPTPTEPIIQPDPIAPTEPVETDPNLSEPIVGTDPIAPTEPVETDGTFTDPSLMTPIAPTEPVETDPTPTDPSIEPDELAPTEPVVTDPTPTDPSIPGGPVAPVTPPSEPAEQHPPGVFVVGNEGQINVEFLFDGSSNIAQMAVFSIEGMENLEIGSTAYMQEAARRALSGSPEGHIVISDRWQSA
ncbi:MAG: choice-of-anchor D domain-containing protein, partial [Chroococcales cyanobacterium]